MRLAAAALLLAATGASAQPQGDAAETTVHWSVSELGNFSGSFRGQAPWKTVRVGDETVMLSLAPLWVSPGFEYSGNYMSHLDVVAAGHYDGLTPDQVTRRQADARSKSRYGFAVIACIDDPDRSRWIARKGLQIRVESATAGTDPIPWAPWDRDRTWRQLRPDEMLGIGSCNAQPRFELHVLERNGTYGWSGSAEGQAARAFPAGVTLRISAGPPPPPPAAPTPPPVVAEPSRPLPSLVVRSPEAEQAAAQRAADAEAARRGEATQRALADIARSREEAARRQAEAEARAAAAQAEYERKKREHEAALARNRAAQEEYRRKCEAVRAKGGSCVIER